MALITELGNIHPALIKLLGMQDLKVSDSISPEGLNEILQANWFQPGKFRFQIEGIPPTVEEIELFKVLDCIEEVHAPAGWYPGLLALGTLLKRVRDRLSYAFEERHANIHDVSFPTVYLLGSRRPLDKSKESADALLSPPSDFPLNPDWKVPNDLPKNEIEMMQFVSDQLDRPAAIKIAAVDTPDVEDSRKPNGFRPANTGDTIERWYTESRGDSCPVGRFLLVSSQPFIGYQLAVARRACPDSAITFVPIGPKANLELASKIFYDNLAKWLYEEVFLRKQEAASIG